MHPWVVHKFGGTSVADAERYRHAAALIRAEELAERQAIVVSAMAGVTDQLLALLSAAARGDAGWHEALLALKLQHHAAAQALLGEAERQPVSQAIETAAAELEHLLRAVELLQGIPGETRDLVSGYGELLSAQMLAAHLGEDAAWLDAREVLVVAHGETGPQVDWERSGANLERWLGKHDQRRVVITGFVARDPEGAPTTLRRNGSDFTASIFARLLEAATITIWTDVDGVLSADPRLVPDAFPLRELSYDEAIELAYFGAKVLHPNTMAPAVSRGIPILIRDSRDPDAPGTRIGPGKPPAGDTLPAQAVRGFTTVDDVALVNVEGTGMIGVPGVAERLFGALRGVGISVTMISQASSEHSICFAVPGVDADRTRTIVEQAFFAELHHGQIQRIEIVRPCTLLAAVGDAMAQTPGVAARLFRSLALGGVNVRAVAQGASERNITVVIDEADSARALRAAHTGFYLSDQSLSVALVGAGVVGRTLIAQLAANAERLAREEHIDLRVRAIARSNRMVLAEDRVDLRAWLADEEVADEPTDLDRMTEALLADRVPHRVIVDCTAAGVIAERYADWLAAGIHVITPNKKAGSGSQRDYERIRDAARRARRHYLYEATVGAGLPIVTTLRDLTTTGDRVDRIEGVLSGTLSYLFNRYDGEQPFSELLREAREAGYTEPDPRDDLSGMDVARKLIILGREMGLALELDALDVENLVPEALRDVGSIDDFLAGLAAHDQAMRERLLQARERNEVLRYVGSVERGDDGPRASVRLRSLPADHPFAGLTHTDNIVAFTTERYAELPLIVRGPGAGPEVTAGGVFGDLLRLAATIGGPT